jgi:hypothetical protein
VQKITIYCTEERKSEFKHYIDMGMIAGCGVEQLEIIVTQ